jgi:hypothetical protein
MLKGARGRWIAGIGLAAIVAVLLVAVYAFNGRERSGGPLNVDVRDSVGAPAKPGRAGVSGWSVVFNKGSEPAVVTSIKPLLVTKGLVIEDVSAQLKERVNDSFCCQIRWPVNAAARKEWVDPANLRSLPVAMPPDPDLSVVNSGMNLVWRLRADQPGRYGFRAVELRYRVGGKDYRRVLGAAFTLCISPDGKKRCALLKIPDEDDLKKL